MDPLAFSQFWGLFRPNTRRFHEVFSHQREYTGLVEQTELLAYLIRSYAVYSMTCAALAYR